jgi:L-seryl-tRNA(Ser) seleniumtransferase
MTLAESLQRGPSLVTCSGDKLLGGPQAGLILGRRSLVEKLARSPVQRALRCDKLTLAALEATLREYAQAGGPADLPLLADLKTPQATLQRRARILRDRVAEDLPEGWRIGVERGTAAVGGGSFAERPVPSFRVVLTPPRESWVTRLQEGLRRARPAVLALAGQGAVRFDLRACAAEELDALAKAVTAQVRALERPRR